jgi:hypothetical protein
MSDEDAPSAHGMEPEVELLREAVTMALYISLSMIAVLLAVPASLETSDSSLALTVGVTAIGLVLAHQIAFRISTRLVSRGQLGDLSMGLLRAQLVGGAVAVMIAVLPILVFTANEVLAAIIALLAFVCLVGYLAARSVPVSRLRAVGYVAGVVAVVTILLIIKSLVGH